MILHVGKIGIAKAKQEFNATKVVGPWILIFLCLYGGWQATKGTWELFVGESIIRQYKPPFDDLRMIAFVEVRADEISKRKTIDLYLTLKKSNDFCQFRKIVFQSVAKIDDVHYHDVRVNTGDNGVSYTRPKGTHDMKPWRVYDIPDFANYLIGYVWHQCPTLDRPLKTKVGPYSIRN